MHTAFMFVLLRGLLQNSVFFFSTNLILNNQNSAQTW